MRFLISVLRKKRIIFFVFLRSVSTLYADSVDINPFGFEIESGTAFMIDVSSGRVLFSKNPHKLIHPASTTKIATVLVAYEKLRNSLEEPVEITRDMVGAVSPAKKIASGYTLPPHWIETASTHMGLKVGEIMSVHDLLRGSLIVSANDASNAIALTSYGSYDAFMNRVNEKARELGCLNTCFLNAHGLYQPQHLTTVYDLTLLARALLSEPVLAEISNTRVFKRPKTNKQEPTLMHNTTLIPKHGHGKVYYSKACGVKFGYTIVSGSSLVAAAKNESRFVLLSISDCSSPVKCFAEAKRLLATALEEEPVQKEYFKAGTILPTQHPIKGAGHGLQAMVKDSVEVSFYPSEEGSVKGRIIWQTLVPPVKKGQYVGRIEIIDAEEKVLASSILVATKDVDPNLTFHVKHWVNNHMFAAIFFCFVTVLALIFLLNGGRARNPPI